jgi:hypothetical protein
MDNEYHPHSSGVPHLMNPYLDLLESNKHTREVVTIDDGTLEVFPSEDETEPENCDCNGLGGFPCWPCVRTGRKELPN